MCSEPRVQLKTAIAHVSSLELQLEEAKQRVLANELQVRWCTLGVNTAALQRKSEASVRPNGQGDSSDAGKSAHVPHTFAPRMPGLLVHAGDWKTPVGMPTVPPSEDAGEHTEQHNNAQLDLAARRRADDRLSYAVDCWMPRSTSTDASCNCLAEAAHPELGSRRTVNVVVASWYASVARPSRSLGPADVVSG